MKKSQTSWPTLDYLAEGRGKPFQPTNVQSRHNRRLQTELLMPKNARLRHVYRRAYVKRLAREGTLLCENSRVHASYHARLDSTPMISDAFSWYHTHIF